MVMASGSDRLAFDPKEFSIPAGQAITLKRTAASVDHDFVVEGAAKYGAAKRDPAIAPRG